MSTGDKKKVFVGLSGGVDSSVAAALLRDEGYGVTGVFIKGWHPAFLTCTWETDRADALRAAAALEIPFETLDLSQEYYDYVVTYLIREYKAGRTPNPDVLCNRDIKFGAFFNWARKQGADFVATGHYARIKRTEKGSRLLTAVDKEKDQTYFLWALEQEVLQHLLFPVGEYLKSHVRELAQRYELPTAEKPDSQGVCFLGQLNMKEFLGHYIAPVTGEVLNEQGDVIGSHDGAAYYTLGQRHGFTVWNKSSETSPLYVVSKDMEANTLTVAPKGAHSGDATRRLTVEECNWFNAENLAEGEEVLGRFRYRQPLFPLRVVERTEQKTQFEADEAVHAPGGQSLVAYRPAPEGGYECLGGGVLA